MSNEMSANLSSCRSFGPNIRQTAARNLGSSLAALLRPAVLSWQSRTVTSHGGGIITRDGCNRGPQAVSPAQTARHVARSVAAGAPAAIRARAVLHAQERRDRARFFRIPSH